METKIKETKAFLFDLDGTLYLGDKLIDGVKETLSIIRSKGIKVVYLTNNSSKTKKEYRKKLKKLGLFDNRDIIYSSLDATVSYLNDNFSGEKVYAVATKKVVRFIKRKGIKISDHADVLVLAFDKEISYGKIVKANELLVKGAKYIATHPDKTCPTNDVYIPDAGSFIELFKTSSGRVPDVIIGKPSTVMSDYIVKMLGLKREEITMVGDRLSTDIQFGINAGFNTVLVYSGETDQTLYNVSPVKADIALKDVNGLIDLI